MNITRKIRYKISFNFDYLENVDQILYDSTILQKSFNKNVSYIIEIEQTKVDKIIYYLLLATSKQIKIENITLISDNNNSIQEVGTDKPLGSKAAIDEN